MMTVVKIFIFVFNFASCNEDLVDNLSDDVDLSTDLLSEDG